MRVVLLLFVVLVLVVFAIVRVNSDRPDKVLANEAALNLTQRAIGVLIAVTAAFGLFLRGDERERETRERQLGYVLPLLGGMLLVSSHWSLALALGAVGVALIAHEWFGKPGGPPPGGA